MHTITIQTKFTFGDHVRFDSSTQGRTGTGKIVGITVYTDGSVDYLIDPEGDKYLQPGIVEHEMILLNDTQAT